MRGEWRGTMQRDRLRVRIDVPATPLVDGYALLARAQWVLLGMRGLPRPRRMELAEDIPLLDWKPWWAPPASAR